MFRFHTKLILRWVIILLALMGIAHLLGRLRPVNPALRGFIEGCEDKPQPCWYGLVPGVTTPAELEQIQAEKLNQVISELSTNNCVVPFSFFENVLYRIRIKPCNITIGDLIQILGTPQLFTYTCSGRFLYAFHDFIGASSRPYWDSPYSKILGFTVTSVPSHLLQLADESDTYQWMSFRPRRAYEQAQPDVYCMDTNYEE